MNEQHSIFLMAIHPTANPPQQLNSSNIAPKPAVESGAHATCVNTHALPPLPGATPIRTISCTRTFPLYLHR